MGHHQSKGKLKAKPERRADRAPLREPAPAQETVAPQQLSADAATTGDPEETPDVLGAPESIIHFPTEIDPTSFLSLLPRDLQKVRASRSVLVCLSFDQRIDSSASSLMPVCASYRALLIGPCRLLLAKPVGVFERRALWPSA